MWNIQINLSLMSFKRVFYLTVSTLNRGKNTYLIMKNVGILNGAIY